MAVTCVTCALAVHPSHITVGRTTDAAIATGAHVPWRLRSSPLEPRAPTSVVGASSARALWLAAGSYPDDRNRLARPFLPYVAYLYFKLFRRFRCMLQLFHLDVAKVDRRMLYILHTLKCFRGML
jgi:hypothetical protein